MTSSGSLKQCSFIQGMHHTCHVIQLGEANNCVLFTLHLAAVWITVVKRVLIFVLAILYRTISQTQLNPQTWYSQICNTWKHQWKCT